MALRVRHTAAAHAASRSGIRPASSTSATTGECTARHREHIRFTSSLFACKIARLRRRLQRHASAAHENRTVGLIARRTVVDTITVAAVEPSLRAKTPDRVMDEPREVGWKGGAEAARIDLAGYAFDDRGATARGVAAGTVSVVGVQLSENAGAVQGIVHQGVNGDHHRAGFNPGRTLGIPSEQQTGQRHRQHLVRHAVDVPERLQ